MINWYSVTFKALEDLWGGFLKFIPSLIGAIIVFIIGWFIAIAVGKLIAEILKRLQFNRLFAKEGMKKALEKADIKIDAAGFIGAIVKWVLVIVFLLASVNILGLKEFAGFLKDVLGYVPNVIAASLIFVVAVIIADVLEKVVRTAVEGIKARYAQLSGSIVKWAIWIFAILAILVQLKVAPALIQTLFTGLIALIVIAAGIAFGLGGKDIATEALSSIRDKFRD